MSKQRVLSKRIRHLFVLLAVLALVTTTSCEDANNSSESNVTSVSVSVVGRGTVALNPSGGVYEEGTIVTLTAEPESGYTFYGFEGDVTSTNEVTDVTVGAVAIDVTAYMPVFMTDTDTKSIVVKSVENPITHMDRVEFLVDLNQPDDDLDTDDGYRVWIWPKEGSKTAPNDERTGYGYRASPVLAADARNISRGGWWIYENAPDEWEYIDGGSVDSWVVSVDYWDADGGDDGDGENQSEEYHEFTFPVSVD